MSSANLDALSLQLANAALNASYDHKGIIIDNQHQKIRLEYATQFILNEWGINAPPNKIHPKTSAMISFKVDTAMTQSKGVLLYKLIPTEAMMTMPGSIYLVLCWKVTACDGLHVHMTLAKHDDYSLSLRSDMLSEVP
jgi:hypothetical protein